MPVTDRSPSPSPVPPLMPEESPFPSPMILDVPIEEPASPPSEPYTALIHDPRETAPCGDKYPWYFLHPESGEPTWEGGPGHNLAMCTAPLAAIPSCEIATTSEEGEIDAMCNPQTYFHGNMQRALWQLDDYGIAADAWRLFNKPQREQTLTERRLRVLQLEALVQKERRDYQEARDKAEREVQGAHHGGATYPPNTIAEEEDR
ncbi:hypothetical protein BC826DRAFT_974714 [Russula brevipes]|nr:hypothetical protein BC826DRAFT_974714 [Russula brevipes]